MKAVLCPVCNGNGLVSAGFYKHPGDHPEWTSGTTDPEQCRSCGGKGWVEVRTGIYGDYDEDKCPICGQPRIGLHICGGSISG